MGVYCGLPVRCELLVGTRTLDLMDSGQGFRIASLDLGFPEIREDATDAPDRAGTIDLTALFGARAVTIAGSIVAAPAGSRSASLALLAPFLDPAARPTLIYQTDTDVEPRQLTLRVSGNTAPLDSISVTAWTASWKAPDGLALGLDEYLATVGPSFMTVAGRTYDLTFDRQYPSSSLPANTVVVVPSGDYPTPPVFTIHGPATGVQITIDHESIPLDHLFLQSSYTVGPGHSIVIDCGARTIVDDTGANVYGDALAGFVTWPKLLPGEPNTVSFFATGTAGASLIDITWHDRWLI